MCICVDKKWICILVCVLLSKKNICHHCMYILEFVVHYIGIEGIVHRGSIVFSTFISRSSNSSVIE
jgi:hypothetical protein